MVVAPTGIGRAGPGKKFFPASPFFFHFSTYSILQNAEEGNAKPITRSSPAPPAAAGGDNPTPGDLDGEAGVGE